MSFYPDRKEDLKVILTRVLAAATLFDDDGIAMRFINWHPEPTRDQPRPPISLEELNHIKDQNYADHVISKTPFKGLTPVGTSLKNHVLEDPSLGIMKRVFDGNLQKPILIITVTDGQPAGEEHQQNETKLRDVIRNASSQLARNPRYGPGAISFQFAQVGNDAEATTFLASLDNDPQVGGLIDCTSSKFSMVKEAAES